MLLVSYLRATSEQEKKGGSKKLVLLGVGGAAAVGIAVAAGGGGGSADVPVGTAATPTPEPTASRADLSAAVISPIHNANLNCQDVAFVTVFLQNNSRSSVSVIGIERVDRVLQGDCPVNNGFTYAPNTPSSPW